jgi:hypothetical protein
MPTSPLKSAKLPSGFFMLVMIRLCRSMVRANSTKPSRPQAAMFATANILWVGHNSWDNAYADPELMTWMLSKSL